jgi:hypothetical protein
MTLLTCSQSARPSCKQYLCYTSDWCVKEYTVAHELALHGQTCEGVYETAVYSCTGSLGLSDMDCVL